MTSRLISVVTLAFSPMRPETVLIAVTPSAPPSRAEQVGDDDGDVHGDGNGGAGGDTCSRNGNNVGDIGGHLGKDGHVR